jgi:hypothetical protein
MRGCWSICRWLRRNRSKPERGLRRRYRPYRLIATVAMLCGIEAAATKVQGEQFCSVWIVPLSLPY